MTDRQHIRSGNHEDYPWWHPKRRAVHYGIQYDLAWMCPEPLPLCTSLAQGAGFPEYPVPGLSLEQIEALKFHVNNDSFPREQGIPLQRVRRRDLVQVFNGDRIPHD